ncbi:MAG TPA: hypothetical protein DIU15_17845, partial [Deltaproteobacteria bacterium]|nr:hypothetical protein [Deltaproteobacteria bacterium]
MTSLEDTNYVLVADSDARSARYFRGRLSESGMEVVVLSEPDAVVDEAKRTRPALIALSADEGDWQTLCSRLRGQEGLSDVPLVVMTAGLSAAEMGLHW